MKFNESILIHLQPKDFCLFEKLSELSDISDVPQDPRFTSTLLDMSEDDERFGTHCGGRIDWGLLNYPENQTVDGIMKVQLMRIWSTQMYTQIAAGLSYTDQMNSTIDVGLTEEELDLLTKINKKMVNGIYQEMYDLSKTMVKKNKIKKLGLTP